MLWNYRWFQFKFDDDNSHERLLYLWLTWYWTECFWFIFCYLRWWLNVGVRKWCKTCSCTLFTRSNEKMNLLFEVIFVVNINCCFFDVIFSSRFGVGVFNSTILCFISIFSRSILLFCMYNMFCVDLWVYALSLSIHCMIRAAQTPTSRT